MAGKYQVDILLSCGCVVKERIAAIIYLPKIKEWRFCMNHKKQTVIEKVGHMYEPQENKE